MALGVKVTTVSLNSKVKVPATGVAPCVRANEDVVIVVRSTGLAKLTVTGTLRGILINPGVGVIALML